MLKFDFDVNKAEGPGCGPLGLVHPKMALNSEELETRLVPLRQAGKKLVFTNGCFDILHPGHVDLLSRARMLGDVLVLALNTDQSVRMLGKGAGRPVNPLEFRAYVAAHLECVDLVTSFSEETPLNLIKAVRPDVLVKGGDWAPERIVGRAEVENRGGLVASLPLLSGFSTTGIIQKIINTHPV